MSSTLPESTSSLINALIEQHTLPKHFSTIVNDFYFPVAKELNEKLSSNDAKKVCFVGIQGSQGSGKSTFADFLKTLLENEFNKQVLVISIDDFYLTKAERIELSNNIHPLFETRGVPGTHDIELLENVFQSIKNKKQGQPILVPTFNKATDDRHPTEHWQKIDKKVDVVILEGWCVGIDPQTEADLTRACNDLESTEDHDAIWRRYVNQQLTNGYSDLYNQLDFLISLLAPSFECVFEWRSLQEQKLIDKLSEQGGDTSKTLSPKQVKRFISHYQRLTEHAIQTMPSKADWLLRLNKDHSFSALERR